MTKPARELFDSDPITLTEASQVVLRGVVSVSALRAEIRRGNLAVERIGKNLYTTPAAIREMREKCRVKQHHHDSTSETTKAATSGSSATTARIDELAALKASVTALKSGSLSTLHKSTSHDRRKVENPIPFPSPR